MLKALAHLVPCVFEFAIVLVQHHPGSKQSHDESMTQVPEHHSKQKWECDDCKRS